MGYGSVEVEVCEHCPSNESEDSILVCVVFWWKFPKMMLNFEDVGMDLIEIVSKEATLIQCEFGNDITLKDIKKVGN